MQTEQILKKKTEYWKKKLIDLSKRNNLVSYRFTKSKSIHITKPTFNQILADINEEKPIYISKENEATIKPRLWNSDEVADVVDKKLTSLYRQAKDNFQELGINTSFLGMVFLKYKDNQRSEESFLAPIFLVPINIEKISSTSKDKHRFELVAGFEEFSINPALIEKLSHNFNLQLPEFDGEVEPFVEKIRKSISGFDSWEISYDIYLDIFSYQKYIMYTDIEDNDLLIKECDLIKGFVGDKNALQDEIAESQRDEFQEDLDGIDVLSADSSQKKAIELAKAGVTFVLQGPPGTGKSQTIANIIAALMLKKKKILFVSQKMAALNVVQKRLEDVGLSRYCLNLHNYKSNKKEIINQLITELETSPKINDSVKRYTFTSYLDSQSKINNYYQFLCKKHKPRTFSLYELRGEIAKLNDVFLLTENLSEVIEYTEERFSQIISIIEKIDYINKEINSPLTSPYYNYDKEKNTGIGRDKLKALVHESNLALPKLQKIVNEIKELSTVDVSDLKQLRDITTKHDLYKRIEDIPDFLISVKFGEYKDFITHLYESHKIQDESVKKILEFAKEGFLSLNVAKYKEIFEKTNFITRLFNQEYKSAKKELLQYSKQELKHNVWIQLFDYKIAHDKAVKNQEKYCEKYPSQLKNTGKCDDRQVIHKLKVLIDKIDPFFTWSKGYLENHPELLIQFFHHIKPKKEMYDECLKLFEEVDTYFTKSYLDENTQYADVLININNIISQYHKLDTVLLFKQEYSKLNKELQKFVLMAFEKNKLDTIQKLFLKSYYIQYMDKILKEDSMLPPKTEIDQFKNLDFEVKDMQRFKIMEAIEKDQPSFNYHSNGTSEVSILKREAEKKRRLKPIRDLLEQIPNLVFVLKPCFMMSPLSVSQYINAKTMIFDVVIFDEASQIMPEDAVPCLLRAKQAIVVGDTQQLPPTSFFLSREDEDVEEEVEDLESFLSECSTKFRTKPLLWHYRSKNENLIAFSNKYFYENRLITFPNAKESDGIGLDYVYVKNAVYDKGKSRKNQDEAREVVKIYKEIKKKNDNKSIGIIAFSIAQENAIREEFKINNIDVDGKVDSASEELFIKNLETVQGDERDIIILSVGYGKDGQGKFSYNFGPLNKEGGYKRLNVAITRSRYKTIVVSSILPNDLDDSKLNGDGPRYLKAYLRFAKDKDLSLFTTATEHLAFDSSFEESVYDTLKKEGLDVVSQVGCSGYRVDLAIKHLKKKGDYILGIECDGAQYHSSKYARDRDKIRQLVLESLGWNIHRIWSDDWLKNRESEIQMIKLKVEAILNNKTPVKKPIKEKFEEVKSEHTFEEKSLKDKYPEYTLTRLPQNHVGNFFEVSDNHIIERLRKVIETEGPIEKDLLYKRVLNSYGIQKLGSKINERLDELLHYLKSSNRIYIQRDTISDKDIKNYTQVRISTEEDRPFVNIPKEELAGAIVEILKMNFSATEDTIVADVAKEIYHNNRTGDKIKGKLKEAIRYLKSKNLIEEDKGTFKLANIEK
ncbi:MAG: DUF3320 domain-containing protein [archaeon]